MSAPHEEVLDRVDGELAPRVVRSNEAQWTAATTGTDQAFSEATTAETELRAWYGDPELRALLKRAIESCPDDAPRSRRQLELLQRECVRNSLPAEVIEDLVSREQTIQRHFVTHRAAVSGVAVTQNRILEIMRDSTDETERLEAWRASKQIGPVVGEELRELVRRRNEAARGLGFRDYYQMELGLQEIGEDALMAIFGQLEAVTREPFRREKEAMDGELRRRLGVQGELKPHHYADPFFQELPTSDETLVLLDRQFAGRDLAELTGKYFESVGLPVDDVLTRSDLYEREGKDQHAFCLHVDRKDDVRVLCNLKDNEWWAGTMLHELGHAAYDRYLPQTLPFLLRMPSHTMTTEAVAMFFGRMSRRPGWLVANCGTSSEDAEAMAEPLARRARQGMLILARWVLVMTLFERELYADPGRRDLNRLWWSLVEELQLLTQPDEVEDGHEWATKIHLAVAPVYYHNYLLGELFASQLYASVAREVAAPEAGFTGEPELGGFLKKKVFAPGAAIAWQALIEHATGQPLNPQFFVDEFVA